MGYYYYLHVIVTCSSATVHVVILARACPSIFRLFTSMVVPLKSIIAICGTTGVGKSKLAIDLALHINRASHISGWRRAKIINADSMQVYKGLDVITNKVSESERQGVEHLLMDFKQPGEQYVVGEWVRDTLKLVRL